MNVSTPKVGTKPESKPEPSSMMKKVKAGISKLGTIRSMDKHFGMKLEKTHVFSNYFKNFLCAGDDRLYKHRLLEVVSKRYPSGHEDEDKAYHPSIADAITKQLWLHFDNAGAELKFDIFVEKLQKFWKEGDHKKFLFDVFDTLHQERLTDESMFRFMEIITHQEPNKIDKPTTILKLNEVDSDMFIRLFAKDFVCVEQALKQKHLIDKKK